MSTIPIIDLAGAFSGARADRRAVADAIHVACRDTGFFYIRNHGVPQSLIDAQFEWARRFFALPLDTKLEIDLRRSSCNRGYERMGDQALEADRPPDLKEGFYAGWHLESDHPLVQTKTPNHGPNAWPRGLPGFAEHTSEFYRVLFDLGMVVNRALALSLDLNEDFFDAAYETPMALVRLLHYPPRPAGAPAHQIGAGAHTDWGIATLLAQDECGGLEIRAADGTWILAPPVPGTFVVNIGDMLERWTNGLYRSTMHRVVAKRPDAHRYSIPFFFDPGYFTRVECLPSCRSESNPPRYAPCTAGEHIAEMYRRTYGPH